MYIVADYLPIPDSSIGPIAMSLSVMLILASIVAYCFKNSSGRIICIEASTLIFIFISMWAISLIASENINKTSNMHFKEFNQMNLTIEDKSIPAGSKLYFSEKVYENGKHYLIFNGMINDGYKICKKVELKDPNKFNDINFTFTKFSVSETPASEYAPPEITK